MAASLDAARDSQMSWMPPRIGVRVAARVELFRRRSSPTTPFHARASREAHRIRDRQLGNAYAFAWKAGKEGVIVCSLEQRRHCCIRTTVRRMCLRVGDGDVCALNGFVQREIGRSELEVKAPLDASILAQNPTLERPRPRRGGVDDRYTPLAVQIEIAVGESQTRLHTLETTLHCRVLSDRRTPVPSVARAMREAWERAPQSVRKAVKLLLGRRQAKPGTASGDRASH